MDENTWMEKQLIKLECSDVRTKLNKTYNKNAVVLRHCSVQMLHIVQLMRISFSPFSLT